VQFKGDLDGEKGPERVRVLGGSRGKGQFVANLLKGGKKGESLWEANWSVGRIVIFGSRNWRKGVPELAQNGDTSLSRGGCWGASKRRGRNP